MNGKRVKRLRAGVVGDPDMGERMFARDTNFTTHLLHPHSYRKQYQEAKQEAKKGRG